MGPTSRPAPAAPATSTPPDRVTLGADLEKAGYSFLKVEPWYSIAESARLRAPRAEELLRSQRAVEVQTPRGYELLFDFAELEAMHALWAGKTELAQTMLDMRERGVRFGEKHEAISRVYAGLVQGKGTRLHHNGEELVPAWNLDELKVMRCLRQLGGRPEEAEKPERVQSLQALLELGLTSLTTHVSHALRLYRARPEETFRLGRLEIRSCELDDSAALQSRLAPLRHLQDRLKDAGKAQEAELMVRTVESERPLAERLDRAEFAFSFGQMGHHDLYRELLRHDDLDQAGRVRELVREPWECRDALLYLRSLPGREDEFLRLTELGGLNWAHRTLQKLGDRPSAEELANAAWSRMKWRHPTLLLLLGKKIGNESEPERIQAFTRVCSDCRGDVGGAREVWKELRSASSLDEAMQAHGALSHWMRQIQARGPGWWEARCLESIRKERRPGGALEGLSMRQGVERLLPFLRRGAEGILLGDQSPDEVVEKALHRMKSGEVARSGVEEREGGVILGGVRIPTRQ